MFSELIWNGAWGVRRAMEMGPKVKGVPVFLAAVSAAIGVWAWTNAEPEQILVPALETATLPALYLIARVVEYFAWRSAAKNRTPPPFF